MSLNKVNRTHETANGEAMQELMLETISVFFLLRAVGKRIGAVTATDGGYWGILRSLKVEGAQTVPQIARSRPVSRQHVQKLANEMIAEGVIESISNPAHQKSKLLQITAKGELVFQEISERIAQEAESLAQDMDIDELQISIKVLRRLSKQLKQMLR
ncbi:MarR family winged helix-turn-helix transcriptional regulator [Pseudanabaena sp. PCC 6802]|uniref:MarR family winged helix-turn-helix transcriptional regulator n=1 Tax=Pseudanabaena sp. PCC 6802 TaxID=118173 RepID=UPI0005649118|nr:MarR family transcriptional regulator [Pseudanabaena sp. PCC 6802]